MLYMVTFTINIPPMLAYIPYDPMGIPTKWQKNTENISITGFLSYSPELSREIP